MVILDLELYSGQDTHEQTDGRTNRLSVILSEPLQNNKRKVVNLIKVSWGLLGPQRTLMAHNFVIGWIHLTVIFIILYKSRVFTTPTVYEGLFLHAGR